jgi:hypothetical protein
MRMQFAMQSSLCLFDTILVNNGCEVRHTKTLIKSIRNLIERLVEAFLTEKVFLVIVLFSGVLIIIGTVFYARWEKISYIDSFLYNVMIITTVGTSDFSPKTIVGKLFTACYALIGTGLFVGLITSLAQAIITQEHNKERE